MKTSRICSAATTTQFASERVNHATLQTVCQKDNSAIAAVEFAMILPVFILLTMGCFEVTRLVLIHQKMARCCFDGRRWRSRMIH